MSDPITFTITSADNGNMVPSGGIKPRGRCLIAVTGGTTIDATFKKDYAGTPDIPPNKTSKEVINAAWEEEIKSGREDIFYIDVGTATGTWTVTVTRLTDDVAKISR